jgi:fused signal recognition particle receptor
VAALLSRWREGLTRTSQRAFGGLVSVLGASEINATTWEELEAMLIQADVGVSVSQQVIAAMQTTARNQGIRRSQDLRETLRAELRRRLPDTPALQITASPFVLLIVGVNGSGKTTTIAKLVKYFQKQGRTVLLGAADTFRAAAVDQLGVWARRLDVEMISGAPESDPGAVVFNTVQAGVARRINVLIIDTAGRLHTRHNLMNELGKIHRVTAKALPGAPHAVWLVLDATTGQNALAQARAFKETAQVTGVILAKLDASARGGMALAIHDELGLPILFAGLGETPDDLEVFDPDAFIQGIMQ